MFLSVLAVPNFYCCKYAAHTGSCSPRHRPVGRIPLLGNQESLAGVAPALQKCSSILYQIIVDYLGRPLAYPGHEPGEPSHFLRACCTLNPQQKLPNHLASFIDKLAKSLTWDCSAHARPCSWCRVSNMMCHLVLRSKHSISCGPLLQGTAYLPLQKPAKAHRL